MLLSPNNSTMIKKMRSLKVCSQKHNQNFEKYKMNKIKKYSSNRIFSFSCIKLFQYFTCNEIKLSIAIKVSV